MARNHTHIDASPDAVWAVLEDPYLYPSWVVGTDRTLRADDSWPWPGSAFTVHVGLGFDDETRVREMVPGRRIVVDAAAHALGPARVTIELRPEHGGTRVTLIEDPAGKMTPLWFLPATHAAIKARNAESLRRLARVVDARVRGSA